MPRPLRTAALLAGLFVVSSLPVRAQGTICPNLTSTALLTCLRASYTPTSTYSYARARDTLFSYVDDGDRRKITDVYAGRTLPIPAGADPTISGCNGDGDNNSSTCNGALNFNTEHAYPQSKGANTSSASGCDMHHLYPARADVNSSRGNNPYSAFADPQASKFYLDTQTLTTAPANAASWSATSSSLGRFRPRAEVRGDLARSIFYFYTIYRTEADAADPAFFNLQKADLLAWAQADPADADEQARSARVKRYQGNDNPFVLDPTLVVRAYFPELMPVELTTFAATADGDHALLRWETASETNNAGFTVEQQTGESWTSLGFVAGHGTTSEPHTYRFTSLALAPGLHRFRLRQTDFDGAFEMSPTVEVEVQMDAPLTLAQRGARFTLTVRDAQFLRVEAFDVLGRRVAVLLDEDVPAGAVRDWTLKGSLPAGTYVVRAVGSSMITSQVVVVR